MTPRVVVVGLGPAGPELVTRATLAAIERVPARFVRTTRHPAASVVPAATSFDSVYDAAATFDEVYRRIVDALVEAAIDEREVLYAVPGSPVVAERTVALLRADRRVAVEVLPALSFLDLAWARLGVDPVALGVRLVDGRAFAVEAAGERGPLLVAQCDTRAVLSDVKLALAEAMDRRPGHPGGGTLTVTVLHHLGLPDEVVVPLRWDELDRSVEPDHLTSVWLPALAPPVAAEVARFAELVRTLRERCPWDREQTHRSLTRHLLEETYEVLEAIEGLDEGTGAGAEHLEEELGDLLFQVVFHATLAAEEGWFTLDDVARGVHDKLVRRHPHVFGDVQAATAEHVVANWERIKQAEKGRESVMDGIPGNLPSLVYAQKIQRKAGSLGLEPPPGGAGLTDTVLTDTAVGDALYALAAAARRAGIDGEAALRVAAGRVRDRVRAVELLAASRGVDAAALDRDALEALWAEVGVGGRGAGGAGAAD
ncbi:MAG: MazG family protein [Acidimicrobiales bacterium]|nr:MazG family protein [Acidimicrobiales bacterium]